MTANDGGKAVSAQRNSVCETLNSVRQTFYVSSLSKVLIEVYDLYEPRARV